MLTEVRNNLKIMIISIKYNLLKCMTNNTAFITSVLFMIFNNASFIIQWLTIFKITDNIGSYSFNEVMLFWAISSGSYGLSNILFYGINRLPEYIETGKLDTYLTTPKNPLCYLATSSMDPSAFGDLIYGYIALIIFNFSLKNIILYTILIIISAIIYTSFKTIYKSLTFFLYGTRYLSDLLDNVFINGSIYPDIIFNKFIKIIFLTLIPCAFASWIPVNLIIKFKLLKLIILIIFTIIITIISFIIFNQGLKHYTSSNLMETRS